jgi:hypothetical protein
MEMMGKTVLQVYKDQSVSRAYKVLSPIWKQKKGSKEPLVSLAL